MNTLPKLIATCVTAILILYALGWSMQGLGKDEATPEVETSKEAQFYEVEMNVSAYCAGECCCGDFADGITASGKPATGKLIAAPKTYAFGTRMDVPGYGMALVEDRGGAIKGNKLDLLFPTHQDALNWGRKPLKVKVYK